MNQYPCHIILLCLTIILSVKTRAQQTDTIIVNFTCNRSDITDTAKSVISNYFSTGKTFTIQHIKLSGHCDNTGSDRYNDSLSFARVKSVKNYLGKNWMDTTVIIFEKGFGKKLPLNDNSTTAYRAANRRVEIILQRTTIDTIERVKGQIIPPAKNASLSEKIMDTATRIGSKIILQNIIFYSGTHQPMTTSLTTMNELLQTMKTNLNVKIQIEGNVCCVPTDADGIDAETRHRDLSVQRAKFIYNFLAKNGIAKSRMTYAGFGASNKLYPEEKNEMEETLNRRVEIKIVNK